MSDAPAELQDVDGDPPAAARRRRVPTWLLIALGLSLGAVLGLGAAALLGHDDDDGMPAMSLAPVDQAYPAAQAENAAAFLDAWHRYRTATFVAELAYQRAVPGKDTPLATTRLVVQDPPRRLVRQGASVTTTDEDQTLLCEPVGDQTVCNQEPGVDYDAVVADEITAWRTAITGDAPAYAIDVPEPGCFELQLVAALTAPPYGTFTRVCFDEATGAIRSRQITRTTGTDTEEASSLSATVTDADWERGGG